MPLPFRPALVACAALLTPGPAQAQDTLAAAVRGLRPGTFALLTRAEDRVAFAAQWDEDAVRLRIEGQLIPITLGPQAVAKAWKSRGWGDRAAWILVDDAGEEVASATGLPPAGALLATLRDKGLTPRWESRRAFLREHPENGDAWTEELQRCALVANLHMATLTRQGRAVPAPRTPGIIRPASVLNDPDPASREREGDEVFGELATALAGARRVEGWWRNDQGTSVFLVISGANQSPRIRAICSAMADDLEAMISDGGSGPLLEHQLAGFRIAAGRPLRELPDRVALPDAQHPFMLVQACMETRMVEEDWQGMLEFLDRQALPGDSGEPLRAGVWETRCTIRGILAARRVRPLWKLGREREAAEALAEARRWGGSALGGSFDFFVGQDLVKEPFYQEALKEPLRPRPPAPPLPPVLRLALLGAPDWRGEFDRLRASAELLPWAPQELRWTSLTPAEAGAVRARQGWGPEARWVLLADDEPLASGTRCPPAGQLTTVLERERPSDLQRIDRILEHHPGHRGAHLARLELLKARMPEPRLERLLAEDARAAFLPGDMGLLPYHLDFGPDAPWKPDAALWGWSAQQVLPRLETLVRSWPSLPVVWKAWVAWARFHPERPSVVALADSLVLWPPRESWLAALPLEVLQAVTEELRRDRNYPSLVRWLEPAWEARLRGRKPRAPLAAWERKEWEAAKEALVVPLVETLRLTGRPERAREVEAAYRDVMSR